MIVKEFNYVKGNTAVKPERKYDDIKRDKRYKDLEKAKRRRNKLAKEHKTKKKTAALQIALVIFVLGVGTIWRDTKVYSLQSQIGGLNDEIKTVNAENEALKVDLLKNSSLKNIEANAKNKLGMITPVDAEKVDVDLSKNYLEGAENNGVEEAGSNNNGLLSKIMDVLK